MPATTSVILQTSGGVPVLERSIESFERQSCLDFELIVCEGGESRELESWIARRARHFSGRLTLVARRDATGRAEALNRALLESRGDTIVIVGADAIAPRSFLAAHLGGVRTQRYSVGAFVRADVERSGIARVAARARFALGGWSRDGVVGQSLSVDRASLFRINGYDQTLRDPARQDLNLRKRLQLGGLRPRILGARARVVLPSAAPLPLQALELVPDTPGPLEPEAHSGLRELATSLRTG